MEIQFRTMTARSHDCNFMNVFDGSRCNPPPIWLMRQAGRYLPEYQAVRAKAGGFLDLCFNPDLAAEVTLQPVERFDLDAAILFADILLIPMGLGVDLSFEAGEGPKLSPIRHKSQIDALLPAVAVDDALAPIAETIRRVRERLPPTKALIGFAGAPWTVATYMVEGGSSRDFALTRRWAMSDPAGFSRLIDRITDATIRYLGAQIAAGVDAVQLFDSWAGALPAELLPDLCFEPARRIVCALREIHPNTPIIGFPRQIGPAVVDYASVTKVNAVGLDSSIDMRWAQSNLPDKAIIQGNLDPIWLEVGGSAMRQAAARILDSAGRRNHIFNLGHGIIKSTPPDHVAELVAYVRTHTFSDVH